MVDLLMQMNQVCCMRQGEYRVELICMRIVNFFEYIVIAAISNKMQGDKIEQKKKRG
jgi:hypothetical protein